ncbi:hypothetical protein K504DRAFT_464889 [Pleomassaria siparia CBS 279.74]|uniref:RING-type domain-containing protein n=1 Tax=Pleomassaria siparia CBS 279.74 TaxID=1314801 RepID=A0A6G1JQ63_9PLEO|nr:hypothetical protein K504DRAFT_464889 [Pleomassaria siparia CBS 279.74]
MASSDSETNHDNIMALSSDSETNHDNIMALSSDSETNHLPTLSLFLRHCLIPCSAESPYPGNAQCTICIESYNGPQDKVSKIVICGHLFHNECIQTWFTSISRMRGTCPNCRTLLFIPDPLTAAQVQQLGDATRFPDLSSISEFIIVEATHAVRIFWANQDRPVQSAEIVDD